MLAAIAGFFALDCQVRGDHVALAEVTRVEYARVNSPMGRSSRPVSRSPRRPSSNSPRYHQFSAAHASHLRSILLSPSAPGTKASATSPLPTT